MTTPRLIWAVLGLLFASTVLLIFGSGCTPAQQAQGVAVTTTAASSISTDVSLLPPGLVTAAQNLVAKHPAAAKYLTTIANGLESIAASGKALPAPDSTEYTLLMWTEAIPEVGAYVTDFDKLYRLYYPTIAPTTAALTQLAEVLRVSTPPPKATPVAWVNYNPAFICLVSGPGIYLRRPFARTA